MRLSWMIGGAQGLGVDTSANVFGAAIARAGYYIFGSREYFSNIKGRHSYFNVLISDSPQHSVNSTVNILATFDAETIFQHYDEVTDFLIYDKGVEAMTIDKVRSLEPEIAVKAAAILEKAGLGISVADVVKFLEKKGVKCIGIDYGPLMKDIINQLKMDPFVAEKARNMLCAGASFGLLGLNQQYLLDAIKSTFKNAKIAE
ncbi:MAG: 2-oxoacid:acceptor oxidoreductase family protein, partial [Candidatus Marsarchaeota archaeon]|nr:2-oxoacid:acceptor oxidoreductase family protein [Candidatus Marsarchaeota archaeon]